MTDPRDKRFPKGILFDLFGTLVTLNPEGLAKDGPGGRPLTIAGLDELLARLSPRKDAGTFISILLEISGEMEEEKNRDNIEIPSHRRFERALERCGLAGEVAEVAAEMTERHMRSLRTCVTLPPGRVELLESLAPRFRLALVSNFDHGATARSVLDSLGLLSCFGTVVISEEVGIRKPAPEIFALACKRLGLDNSDCIHVGDSLRADVGGAVRAGIRPLWVTTEPERDPGVASISDVSALPAWIERNYPLSAECGGPE